MEDVYHDTAERSSHHSNGPAHLTPTGHRRDELVRLLLQAMDSLGYSQSVQALEKESGLTALSNPMRHLRHCILQGLWTEVASVLQGQSAAFLSENDASAARFIVYEQQFLELLDAGKTMEALACLRNYVTPNCPRPDLLHKLPLLCMCSTAEEVRERANWPGTGTQTRSAVLRKLLQHIPADCLFQEDRLEVLLRQALDVQRRVSKFPYTKQNRVSLLEDLEHSPERIPRTERFRLKGHTDEVWFVQFSHDGDYLASASKDTSIIIWNYAGLRDGLITVNDAIWHRLNGHSQDICLLSWSPNDKHLLSCGKDCSIRLWDVESGEFIRTFSRHKKHVTACSWMPHGRTFVSGSVDKQICEWDAWTGEAVAFYNSGGHVLDLGITTDGKRLVVICADNAIPVFDTETKALLFKLSETDVHITSMSLSIDGRYLLLNTKAEAEDVDRPELRMWDLEEQRVVMKFRGFKQKRYVIRACFGGFDQMLVVCGSEDSFVYMWERDTGEMLAKLSGHNATVNSVAWNPCHQNVFASGSDDTSVIIWGVCEDAD